MALETRHCEKTVGTDCPKMYSLAGDFLDLKTLGNLVSGETAVEISTNDQIIDRVHKSHSIVEDSVERHDCIYGVTTGFGGMANDQIPSEFSSRLQNNLLNFLSAGSGDPLPKTHVRGAMILRANMLLQGHSGIRLELIKRLVQFVQQDAIPRVHEYGSIGASGDLIPLATIARAIVGHSNAVKVYYGGEELDSHKVLQRLNLETISLKAKEGLALINGTSFSAAIAANTLLGFKQQFALSLGINAMLLRAKLAHEDPFLPFVHDCKPHPGQKWTAKIVLELMQDGAPEITTKNQPVQDRYSVRCAPQYLGGHAETLARLIRMIELEMNSVSDNPIVNLDSEKLVQSGNFLGQYIGVGMDELRRVIALTAKHLDVQIAHLVAPEFSGGLSPSLRGNDEDPVNMGLKGLQIAGNSLVPMLLQQASPLVEHFPTYAEQFNQNVNGLSWGCANLAWKSNSIFGNYLAIALMFSVQACDLRAKQLYGHYDGSELLGTKLKSLYHAVLKILECESSPQFPLLFDDRDRCLEVDVERLANDIHQSATLTGAMADVVNSFESEMETS